MTDFLADPTVHNALLSSMALTALITAMPTVDQLKQVKWKELPLVVYKYVYDALHAFMSLKTGREFPPPPPPVTVIAPVSPAELAAPLPPIRPAPIASESQPATMK